MRLENYCRGVFLAGSGGLAHHDVADGIRADGDIMLCCEVEQVLTYFFFLLRGTGHMVDLVENREYQCGLEIFDRHGGFSIF